MTTASGPKTWNAARRRVGNAGMVALLLLSGCSTAPLRTIDDSNVDVYLDAFTQGKVQLSNSYAVIKNHVDNRRELLLLYRTRDWPALAKLVMRIDFNQNLSWFYLGSAAEGLGYREAASIYYRRAVTVIYTCDHGVLGNQCDGFVLPRDAEIALTRSGAAR